MSLLWPTLLLAHTSPYEERMRKPSDRHSYSNRENPAYFEQWCDSSSKDTDLGFVLIYVTAVPWVCRDGAGGTWNVKHELCNTLSSRVGNILGPAEGDVRESVRNL